MIFLDLVRDAVTKGASDIHLCSGNLPAFRWHGKINYWDLPKLTETDVDEIVRTIVSKAQYEHFSEYNDVDAAIQLQGIGRFRINVFRQRSGISLVMRVINEIIPELPTLNLPNSIGKVLDLREGLILVTGPTGSGKSTTLAAVINEINKTRDCHIITIEDPVEYLHMPKRSLINQRELGRDATSYAAALRAALREDPDVILLGEIRDFDSMQIALSAAETGHLVLSTLHTEGAAKTIDRLIDMFPAQQQKQALGQISTTLKAVISQRLLPRSDIHGRIGAFEVMFGTNAVANLIREGKIAQIDQMIQISSNVGMITRNKSIQYLFENGFISEETAREYSFDVNEQDAPVLSPQSMQGGYLPNSRR